MKRVDSDNERLVTDEMKKNSTNEVLKSVRRIE